MNEIISPLGTALWLKRNTQLTNRQIAQACNIDILEVAAMHENSNIIEYNPIKFKQFAEIDIANCEKNSDRILTPIIDKKYKHKYIISKYALKQAKDNNQMLSIISYLMNQHRDIKPSAISRILKISAANAELMMSQAQNSIQVYINPVEVRICTKDVLNKIILLADIESYHKVAKKLNIEQISGIIHWLKQNYKNMNIYDIYNILFPITETKINIGIKKHEFSMIYHPIEHGIMTLRYIEFMTKYII